MEQYSHGRCVQAVYDVSLVSMNVPKAWAETRTYLAAGIALHSLSLAVTGKMVGSLSTCQC